MKVAIPTENMNGLESVVYGHFGSAPYYAVYEALTDSLGFIDNGNKEHEHGLCQPAVELKENNIEAVVCGGMGMRAINNLNGLGIKVYFTNNAFSVGEIIVRLKNNELQEIKAENACSQHGCH